MKRFLLFIACIIFSLGSISLNATKVVINGDVTQYKFAYVIPTSGVTSSSGGEGYVYGNQFGVFGGSEQGPTRTVNPAETIAGKLMKMGYTILPQISQDFRANTLIVSYGYLDGKGRTEFSYASASIMIQFRDAMTQELVASFETIGTGKTDSESIADAIGAAMELFGYSIDPKIELELGEIYKKCFYLYLTNRTLQAVNNVVLRVTYYLEDQVVYEQTVNVKSKMLINEQAQAIIKRDKPAQSRKMQVRVNVLSYN